MISYDIYFPSVICQVRHSYHRIITEHCIKYIAITVIKMDTGNSVNRIETLYNQKWCDKQIPSFWLLTHRCLNSLASWKYGSNINNSIHQFIIENFSLGTCCGISLRWMLQNNINTKSSLVRVAVRCRQATRPYLSQRLWNIKNNAWITMNNDFDSRVRWFANDFHSWLYHSWKSLANHITVTFVTSENLWQITSVVTEKLLVTVTNV